MNMNPSPAVVGDGGVENSSLGQAVALGTGNSVCGS